MHTKLIIFGITGDLSRRKLLPALSDIVKSGQCQPLSIIGVSRRDVDVADVLGEHAETLASITRMAQVDVAKLEDYHQLRDQVSLQQDEQAVIYLSVPPGAAADVADFLGEAGLNGPNVKLLFEKPFGYDAQSAHDFIQRTRRYFDDGQLYRIDHYMAKEVAMALLELRSDAASHHHQWSSASVERVKVLASETLGVEDRAQFYEQTGALRDVVQGHLLQLLSLVLMEPVATDELSLLPAKRLAALASLHPVDPSTSVRAQYADYDEEVGNPGSQTETFVSLDLASTDARWKNVPIRLTTGKRLSEKKTAVTIEYTDGTKDVFIEGEVKSSLDQLRDAYERVLVEAINGNKHIFTTSPEIIRAWEILADVQQSWAMNNQPLLQYEPGTRAGDVHIQPYI
ncbi:MAG TPA: hypothetical protein QF549_02300 [Candidatus Saccharimonadaceae bacterium]|nr:hypothetical protein [Candidatus Saccharimonadaceae bacterium]